MNYTEQRLAKFHSYKEHVIHRKVYKRFSKIELQMCIQFILDTGHLDKNEFSAKVNRWFLGDTNRPTHHVDMWALVSQVCCQEK